MSAAEFNQEINYRKQSLFIKHFTVFILKKQV